VAHHQSHCWVVHCYTATTTESPVIVPAQSIQTHAYPAIRQIQAVIGHCSFMNFGLNEAKTLAGAYPEKTAYGARDKTQKMIAKTYRGLDQSTQREIDEDIPRLLRIAYGSLKRRTRSEQTIQTDSLADFWGTLMRTPCPNELHRDALVLALLTGERKG